MDIKFKFNEQKTIEAIIYLASRIRKPTKLSICKLLYFADKTSLEEYGRFITGDNYVAMEYGPVPSNAFDLINGAGNNDDFQVDNKDIVPLRQADEDEFSRSDIEVLDRIISEYGNKPAWELSRISHDEAYDNAWMGGRSSYPMPVEDIVEMFDNTESLLDFLLNRHNDE